MVATLPVQEVVVDGTTRNDTAAMADDPPSPEGPHSGSDLLGVGGDGVTERVAVWLRWVGGRRLVTGAGALVVIAALGWWLLRSPATPTEAHLPAASRTTSATSTAGGPTSSSPATDPPPSTAAAVIVHVAGAVSAPGVYELPAGSRVGDAIRAAGGARSDGDPDALNLAAPVADGDRIAVPVAGATDHGALAGVSHATTDAETPAGPVDLNQATVDQLDALPGVGPATAAAIVAHREADGPFATVDDLEAVRGIGPAKLESLRPLVTV